MYTDNPIESDLDRIRVYITDTDNNDLLISQSELEFFYQETNQNVNQTAIKCLKLMLMKIAKMGDEKVGGVEIKNGERIANLKSILHDVETGLITLSELPYAGGISRSDIKQRLMMNTRPFNPFDFKDHSEYGDVGVYGEQVITYRI